eukprot:540225-Pyramimonas_sp.AAC.1
MKKIYNGIPISTGEEAQKHPAYMPPPEEKYAVVEYKRRLNIRCAKLLKMIQAAKDAGEDIEVQKQE